MAPDGSASLGIKPELLLPTGKEGHGLGNGRASLVLTLIGSYDAAPWAFHANVGMTVNRYALQAVRDANRSTLWRASVATSYAFNEQWKLVADTGVARSADRTSDHPVYLLSGVIYSPPRIWISTSAPDSASDAASACPDWTVNLVPALPGASERWTAPVSSKPLTALLGSCAWYMLGSQQRALKAKGAALATPRLPIFVLLYLRPAT